MLADGLVKTANVDADVFEDELILMNLDTRKVLVLNESARVIWEALDHFRSRAELLAILKAGMAEADPSKLESGLADLLDTLGRYGFIHPTDVG